MLLQFEKIIRRDRLENRLAPAIIIRIAAQSRNYGPVGVSLAVGDGLGVSVALGLGWVFG